MKELTPGTSVLFADGSKRRRGTVVRYPLDSISKEKAKEIKKHDLILVQTNQVEWIKKSSIIEVLGEDFWFKYQPKPARN